MVLNELILKSKAMIRDIPSIHHAVISEPAQPSSYTTSVVDAPKKDKQSRLKSANNVEVNLRELLLESMAYD